MFLSGKKLNAQRYVFLAGLLLFVFLGCTTTGTTLSRQGKPSSDPVTLEQLEQLVNAAPASPAEERDMIFTLAAYALVYKNWQTPDEPRGHNIGCIVVDKDNNPVYWGLNSNEETNDSTQHGEVRAMQGYIAQSGNKYLDGYTIYTTLEPCAMCSGMMSLTKVARVVYGQTDDGYPDPAVAGYGRAIERLKLDSTALSRGGYKPYPRTPNSSEPSTGKLFYRKTLEDVFQANSGHWENSITKFLVSDAANQVYTVADFYFGQYTVLYAENQKHLDDARSLVNNSSKATS